MESGTIIVIFDAKVNHNNFIDLDCSSRCKECKLGPGKCVECDTSGQYKYLHNGSCHTGC